MANTALQINDLFVLSDVLQMELYLTSKGVIEGDMSKQVSVPALGLKMNIRLRIVSSKIAWATKKGKVEPTIGLILHVQGDLYMVAVNDKAKDEVLIMLVDQSKLADKLNGFFEKYPKNGFPALLELMMKGTVALYTRAEYGATWLPRLEKQAA